MPVVSLLGAGAGRYQYRNSVVVSRAFGNHHGAGRARVLPGPDVIAGVEPGGSQYKAVLSTEGDYA